MYSSLIQNLVLLKGYGAKGVKTSFEDEGARPQDILKLRYVTSKTGLDLNVKIGGAEAKTDFDMAINMDVDSVVAPMIESSFALSKFTSFSKNVDITRGINIESKQGVQNLGDILASQYVRDIDYICIGRSDMAASYNQEVFSVEFCDTVVDTLTKIKDAGIKTCMGGTFDSRSYEFVKFLHEEKLIDKVETRYIIFNMDDHFIKHFDTSMSLALGFEYEYMNMLLNNGISELQLFENRAHTIRERIVKQIDCR